MQGLGLVKSLAERERELAKKLEVAQRAAEAKLKEAQVRAARIHEESRSRLLQTSEEAERRTAEEEARVLGAAVAEGEVQVRKIREEAEGNLDKAVAYVLSKVVP